MFGGETGESGWAERLDGCARAVERLLAELEADVLSGAGAQLLVARFTRLERLAVAGRLAVLGRYEKSNVWAEGGDRDPAVVLARLCGTTRRAANDELNTAQRLEGLAETAAAARQGRLSPDQIREVAAGAAAAPDHEADLLDCAENGTLRELAERSRQARFAAEDEQNRRNRHRRNRHARHYRGPDGDGRIVLCDAPDVIAPLWAAVQAAGKLRFEHARANGEREAGCAYLADALEALIRRGANTAGRDDNGFRGDEFLGDEPVAATVTVIVDLAAYQRGHAQPGETAEVDGTGPVCVASIRDMAKTGFITLSLYDGVDVHRVARPGRNSAHLLDTEATVRRVLEADGVDIATIAGQGRHIPAHLRTALIVRDRTCTDKHCDSRLGLEIDHVDPVGWGINGPTTYNNLARKCRPVVRTKRPGMFDGEHVATRGKLANESYHCVPSRDANIPGRFVADHTTTASKPNATERNTRPAPDNAEPPRPAAPPATMTTATASRDTTRPELTPDLTLPPTRHAHQDPNGSARTRPPAP